MYPVILLIVGGLLFVGGFLFGLFNMFAVINDDNRSLKSAATGHVGAMVVMAIGLMIFAAGGIWGLVILVQ